MAERPFNVLSLCTGGGGLDLAVELAVPGARVVCGVEWEAFACAYLVACMEAGAMAPFPLWSNLKTFDGRPWRGVVDCLTAGFPCQPFSTAGLRRGSDDPRHLWPDVARVIAESGVPVVILENVPGLVNVDTLEHNPAIVAFFAKMDTARAAATSARERWAISEHRRRLYARWMEAEGVSSLLYVIASLEGMGYRVAAGLFTASEVGAPHLRKRLFILGVADASRRGQRIMPAADGGQGGFVDGRDQDVAHRDGGRRRAQGHKEQQAVGFDRRISIFPPGPGDLDRWREVLIADPSLEPAIESPLRDVADGLARDRRNYLRLTGNGVVPLAAANAFLSLWSDLFPEGAC